MKINDLLESTTSGAIANVASGLGTQSRAGKLFKGKKTKKPFYEGKMKELSMDLKKSPEGLSDDEFKKKYNKTKAEMREVLKSSKVNEADIAENDLIIVPGQGHKLKPGLITKDKDRRDHEVEMARSDLFQAAKNAKTIYELIANVTEDEGLPGWIQEKIIKANDYLNAVREYIEHEKMSEMTAGTVAGGIAAEGRDPDETRAHNDAIYKQMFDVIDRIKKGEEEAAKRRRKIFHPEEFDDEKKTESSILKGIQK